MNMGNVAEQSKVGKQNLEFSTLNLRNCFAQDCYIAYWKVYLTI